MRLPRSLSKQIYKLAIRAAGERMLFGRLRDLRQMQWESRDHLLAYQKVELHGILSHAIQHSPFYAERVCDSKANAEASENLSMFPLLDKSDLQRHSDDIRSRHPAGRVSRKTTGGSTGEPVTVLKDRAATAYERAAMWLAYGWFGVEMGDRGARFWGTPFTLKRRVVSGVADFCMNRIRFSAFEFDEDRLADYWARLCKFKPDYVHGYVSMLEQLARSALDKGLSIDSFQLKSVVATSEVLTPPQREVIEEAFDARVQIEYGCGEVGPIAHECPHGSLHLAAANLWVELLRPDGSEAKPGESGEIVLTDLHNRAMPLIRYRVGDYGVRGDGCPCGRAFPVLEKVWGRAYDFVEDPAGRRYHGEFFMYVFEDLRSSGVPIGQFQVLQRAPDSIKILVTSEDPLAGAMREKIVGTVNERLPGVRVQLEQVSEIPREESGKMRVIKKE